MGESKWAVIPHEVVSYILEFFVHPKNLIRRNTILNRQGVPIQTYMEIENIPTLIKWHYKIGT
jgi:hypothetical protein